jgi:hypothetical protein
VDAAGSAEARPGEERTKEEDIEGSEAACNVGTVGEAAREEPVTDEAGASRAPPSTSTSWPDLPSYEGAGATCNVDTGGEAAREGRIEEWVTGSDEACNVDTAGSAEARSGEELVEADEGCTNEMGTGTGSDEASTTDPGGAPAPTSTSLQFDLRS